ncbi:MAG: hypothetical protein K6A34_06130 [Methanobrevibacter sp.]|nr:hypothetical protein [Methanobrevibacter sp.]
MTIEQTPNITYTETDQNPKMTGSGAVIPLIIGQTGNTVDVANIAIKKYKGLAEIGATVANGGIGNADTNMSYQFFKKFLKETKKIYSDDAGLPYVYFIDMGSIAFSNGEAWAKAFNLAMTQKDIGKVALVGFKKADKTAAITAAEISTIVGIISSGNTIIVENSKKGSPKRLMFTVEDATDADMMKLTDDSSAAYIQKSRVLPCVPDGYPEIVARFCLTPYDEEPGYFDFRSVSPDDVVVRTEDMEEDLQNAGINFIRKEMEGSIEHAKICLGVSSAMAASVRPNDVLPHFRRNVDHLINRIYVAAYPYLKKKELQSSIKLFQTDINNIVEEEIEKGAMQEGTEVTLAESSVNPFQMLIKGNAKPVNSTLYIGFEMYISEPDILAAPQN